MEAQAEVPAHCCRTGLVPAAPLTPSQGHWTTEPPAGTAPRTRQQESVPKDTSGPWQESASARQTPEEGDESQGREAGGAAPRARRPPVVPTPTCGQPAVPAPTCGQPAVLAPTCGSPVIPAQTLWATSGPGSDPRAPSDTGADPQAPSGPGTDLWATSGPGTDSRAPSGPGAGQLTFSMCVR